MSPGAQAAELAGACLIVHMAHDLCESLLTKAGPKQQALCLVERPPEDILDLGMGVVQVTGRTLVPGRVPVHRIVARAEQLLAQALHQGRELACPPRAIHIAHGQVHLAEHMHISLRVPHPLLQGDLPMHLFTIACKTEKLLQYSSTPAQITQ